MSDEVITAYKLQQLRKSIAIKLKQKQEEAQHFLDVIVEEIPSVLQSGGPAGIDVEASGIHFSVRGELSATINFEYTLLRNVDLRPRLNTVDVMINVVTAPDGVTGYKVTVGSDTTTTTAASTAARMIVTAHKQEMADFLESLS